jgi:hypothetical protein
VAGGGKGDRRRQLGAQQGGRRAAGDSLPLRVG